MNLFDIFLLAIALGVDCLIASFAQGLIFNKERLKNSLIIGLTFGGFQGLMPFIGFWGTEYIHDFISQFSKWIIFTIFLVLGLKFILDSKKTSKKQPQCIGIRCLISLGIATSIDALLAGATLNLTETNLYLAALIIGSVAFVMSIIGFWTNYFTKNIPSDRLGTIGGIILIFLAIKSILF